jgi:hypothetical protein
MSLARRAEVRFDADVELLIATLEPAAAASAEGRGLFDLVQAEKRAIEFSSSLLATFRRGELDMVNACNHLVNSG